MNYATHFNTKATPQTQAIPGREADMVANSAGGVTFKADPWARLDRFLVLGSEGGSYYASERKLTVENAQNAVACIKADGRRAVDAIVAVSDGGRAPKNDQAVFALALAAAFGDPATKRLAAEALPKVCRTGTHLFQFVEAADKLRGWGKGLRKAVAGWYHAKSPGALAHQVTKYQQRDGWSHRDVLRLCHAKFEDAAKNAVAHWAVKGWDGVGEDPHPDAALRPIWAFERLKKATSKGEVAALVREYRLPRECVPTQFLTEPEVWEALLEEMPVTAMVRNLGNMTKAGVVAPMSAGTRKVVEVLGDVEALKKARVHPLTLLVALKQYELGRGMKGSNTWAPVTRVVEALDQAFYLAFRAVEPTNKRWLLALDVSGSMASGGVCGSTLTPRDASAALALVTAATEKDYAVMAFSATLRPLDIGPRMRLTDAVRKVSGLNFSGTDCSLPMLYAMERKIPVDVFTVLTDSETYSGKMQPVQALQAYRQKTGIPAKLVVVGMVSNGFTIADPNDPGMLDVVGMDTSTPAVMADFARN